MDNQGGMGQGRRLSRREFAACQLAMAPVAMIAAEAKGASADDTAGAASVGPAAEQYQRCVDRALGYLQSQGQAADGSFSNQAGIGITALVTTAVLRHGRSAHDPLVARSLKCLESFVRPDGSVCSQGGLYANYETCLTIACFTEANADKRYDRLIRNAEAFIKKAQWDEDEGKDRADLSYGGAGYGKHKRPDLSNTAFFLDALKACGDGPDDPAVQKALVFVSRCQNLESEHNTSGFAAKNPDGGFYYTCAAGGSSMAGSLPNGGLRSYASMTYSGLKSMIYAGVTLDDPRVKAAVEWIRKNYDLKSNPGMGTAGLYYYYHVYAKALSALGTDSFTDAAGVKHDWRRELAEELFSRQKENGSWTNSDSRWLEGDPNLVTGYALLALSYCRPAARKQGS